MSELITLINYIAVSIFGSILSAVFCGIGKEKKQTTYKTDGISDEYTWKDTSTEWIK